MHFKPLKICTELARSSRLQFSTKSYKFHVTCETISEYCTRHQKAYICPTSIVFLTYIHFRLHVSSCVETVGTFLPLVLGLAGHSLPFLMKWMNVLEHDKYM